MRNPTSRVLAMRDPAAAVLLGALAAPGSDFGVSFGNIPQFGNAPQFGNDYGFGDDAPTAENMAKAWQEKQLTKKREMLLTPNAGSAAKIQRYTFGLSQTITLETAVVLALSGNPQVYIRPQRVTTNAPCAAFARLTSMQVGNVGVIVGGGIDAFDLAAQAQDAHLDVPTIGPQNQVQVGGNYDGLLPSGGYVTATAFRFITSFKGPASMTPSV